jgi:hypothetical protein
MISSQTDSMGSCVSGLLGGYSKQMGIPTARRTHTHDNKSLMKWPTG